MTAKKSMKDGLWFVNGMILGVAVILLGLAAFSKWSDAATYNMIFNNVEQGPNSTASPKVSVVGGKATKSTGTDETTTDPTIETPANAATPDAAVAGAKSEATAAKVADASDKALRPLRLGFMANSLNISSYPQADSTKVGGTFSLGYFPLKDFGLNTFIASTPNAPHAYYGGEIEFVPIRAGIFGWKDALEIQGMVGASTLGRDLGTQGERGSIHAGVGATVNFGDRYGVMAEMRTNLSDRSDYKYWLASAGLVVRF